MTERSKVKQLTDKTKTEAPLPETEAFYGKWFFVPGEWMYEDRKAFILTVAIFFLLLLNIFLSAKIIVNHRHVDERIVPERVDQARELKLLEKDDEVYLRLLADYSPDSYRDVRNRVSNENAPAVRQYERWSEERMRESESQIEERLLESDRRIQEQIRSNREMYEEGLRESGSVGNEGASGRLETDRNLRQSAVNSENGQSNTVNQGDSRSEGRVTVSFSLGKPIRNASKLQVPAYRCESGGKVVVNVAVNRNGDVVSAEVEKSLSSSDHCMTTAAVESAYASRFNVNQAAPAKQTGTITYIFIPQ